MSVCCNVCVCVFVYIIYYLLCFRENLHVSLLIDTNQVHHHRLIYTYRYTMIHKPHRIQSSASSKKKNPFLSHIYIHTHTKSREREIEREMSDKVLHKPHHIPSPPQKIPFLSHIHTHTKSREREREREMSDKVLHKPHRKLIQSSASSKKKNSVSPTHTYTHTHQIEREREREREMSDKV
jgi:hypothetical protein